MSTGELLILLLIIATFAAFAGVLAFGSLTWQPPAQRSAGKPVGEHEGVQVQSTRLRGMKSVPVIAGTTSIG